MSHLHSEDFRNPTNIDTALKVLFNGLEDLSVPEEPVLVSRALGRYLVRDVYAEQDLPQFDRAVMDGYAVRSDDVKNSSEQNPTVLQVVGESRLGEVCRTRVKHGQAVAVATGSVIPPEADTVVIVERTGILPGARVAVRAPATPGQSIARKGEDVPQGTVVLKKSTRLRPQDLGILKTLGFARVSVARKPRVAVISTGDELVDKHTEQMLGRTVDINRTILSEMLRELGADPIDLGIVKDNKAKITALMKKGLKKADAMIITAGSSVGKRDLVPGCINSLGKPGMLVHGIAMRPAMPTGLAVVNGKPVLSLPGFPVSAVFGFRVFARPVIARLMGLPEFFEPVVKATLKKQIVGSPGLRTFVRVRVEKGAAGLLANPLELQRSSSLMSLVGANGIVTVPENVADFEEGRVVDVTLIGPISS
jgi:molybdopterin molybdotransferase